MLPGSPWEPRCDLQKWGQCQRKSGAGGMNAQGVHCLQRTAQAAQGLRGRAATGKKGFPVLTRAAKRMKGTKASLPRQGVIRRMARVQLRK